MVMSYKFTPRVTKNYALASAVVERQAAQKVRSYAPDGDTVIAIHCDQVEVIQEMETEHVMSGDYAAANQTLELTLRAKLTEEDLDDADTVRAKVIRDWHACASIPSHLAATIRQVRDLTRLGEMRWRYRVVDEGQNPRDEAIVVLEEAKDLVSSHTDRVVEAVRARRGDGAAEAESRKLRLEWGAELAEISQGLALANLIFTTDRSEDARIEKLLREASILPLLYTPCLHIGSVSFLGVTQYCIAGASAA